ncbi:MAG TPA: hypothetical protein PKB10_05740 [Tepidisphaeraceae bacterium]|nr:hypothetical protein [Tepidisphaeraceae bacterium]
MRYLDAERTLEQAEQLARDADDLDTLARLYMPLQETRRQKRQRCGEGIVRLDLIATSPDETLDPESIATQYPHGQLLVAGAGTLWPAIRLREIYRERQCYAETFLAASYLLAGGIAVLIAPTPDVQVPAVSEVSSIDRLVRLAPPHSLVLRAADLPAGAQPGTTQTFAYTMDLWERLARPFLALADATADPRQRIDAYRRTLRVDPACELAHQNLSETARTLLRARR